MKHTEVPNEISNLRDKNQLEHGDKIIYATIRRYMNKETRDCFPSINTIAVKLNCSKTKVLSAIKRLLDTELLEKHIDGRKNHYKFPLTDFDKHFEMFTDEFLDSDLPLNVKEYYMDIQPFLYGKETGVGKCSFSNAELARRTGWTTVSVKKYNTILIEKGLLSEEVTNATDESGLPIVQKAFNLTGLHQAALWVKAVTEQITINTQDIEDLKEENKQMRKELDLLKKEMSLKRNQTTEFSVEF